MYHARGGSDVHKSAERGQKLPPLRVRSRQKPTLRATGGFTLIEMMVVVVVLGILATIGANLIVAREKAYLAVMKADLRNIAAEQAPHVIDNYQYANAIADLPFTPSEGITLELLGETRGFTARTTHLALPGARCALFMGTVSSIYSPATVSGVMSCDGGGGGGGGP
jgi:prepilin-type N-terminal cleavage/methylation domain-containing protein